MGIHGLTMFIEGNSEMYLKPYKLCDCYIVIDGSNISSHLYKWVSTQYSAFGGDYDEYYQIVKDFFLTLKKCNVTPIVLFDGGYDKQKLKTVLSRTKEKLLMVKTFVRGFSSAKFYPLFLKETFIDVMEDLGIFCIQCDMEADGEIAAVARALGCPVLSYDSDFFIFDILYIPISSVHLRPVKFNDSDKYYVRCSIYEITNLLNQFEGLDKTHLPIIAALLGNDFIDSSMFKKFFDHIIINESKYKSYTQRKIYGLLHWMKKEDANSAIELILSHLENKSARKVLEALRRSGKYYRSFSVSECVFNILSQIKDVGYVKKKFTINLPNTIINHYCNCKIGNFIINMINFGTYFTKIQIENVLHQSSYMPSLQLISDMYTILIPYMKNKPKFFKLYLVMKNHYNAIKIEADPGSVRSELHKVKLNNILKQPQKERLKFLCQIANIDVSELKIVCSNNWSLFIMSFIYWIRKLNSLISLEHIHALVLMMIANQVIQKFTGYIKSFSQFTKNEVKMLTVLKNTPVATREYKDFEEMLEGVTQYERLLIQNVLIPYRRATEKEVSRKYSISTIHLFACFQSCLYHLMQWNALLNFPIPHCKISDFYSGTLLFNFYLIIQDKPQVERFGCNLFKDAPNLAKIYKYLYEGLCRYSEKVAPIRRKQKKKKHKKIRDLDENEDVSEEKIISDTVSENNFYDESNYYTMLQNIKKG